MDLKAKIEEIVDKVKNDKTFAEKFQSNPVAAVEELTGVDLPDGQVEKLVDGIKAKLGADKLGSALGGLFGKK